MLLVAAVVVVASRWESIAPEVRVTGLVAALMAAFFGAERLRAGVPTTATAVAALAATVTAPTGIAAAATLAGTWPTCLLVGGTTALVATEIQARRWRIDTLTALTTVAAGLVAVGASARTGVPVILLGAAFAASAAMLGARLRSVALAAATAAVALLGLVARPGSATFGAGTVRRLGIEPDTLSWAAPLALIAVATVIAGAAERTRNRYLAVAALAVAAEAGIVWLVTTTADVAIRWMLPSIVVAVLLLLSHADLRRSRPFVVADLARTLLAPLSWSISASAVALPVVAAIAPRAGGVVVWSTPAFTTAVALLLVRLSGRGVAGWVVASSDLVTLGSAAALLGGAVATGLPPAWAALLGVGSWIAVSATTSWSTWRPTSLAHSVWIVALAMSSDVSPGVLAALLGAAGGITVISLVASRSVAVAAAGVPVTVMMTVGAVSGVLGRPVELGIGVAITSIATAGFSVLHPRHVNVAVLAGSLGLTSVLMSLDAAAVMMSLAVLLLAAQVAAFGDARGETAVRRAGIAAIAASILSLWWTTGANTATIAAVAPYGATGADLAMIAIGIVLLAAGAGLRSISDSSSWLAHGPGLAIVATWLLARQLDHTADWATFGGIVFGVAAVGIGGSRRLAAPLVIGTVTVLATLVVSAGPRLADAPTWVWIAGGGALLLVVAGLIERVERPLLPSDDDPGRSVAELLRRRFD